MGYRSYQIGEIRDTFCATRWSKKLKIDTLGLYSKKYGFEHNHLEIVIPYVMPITDENVLSLVKLAERFDIQTLLNKCLTCLNSDGCGVWTENKFYFAAEWNFDYYKVGG